MKNKGYLLALICIILSAFHPVFFDSPGLDSPTPIGKFINDKLPSQSPGDGGPISWQIEPTYPALFFKDPLVIVPHPNADRLYVGSRQGLIETFLDQPEVNNKQVVLDIRDRVAEVWDAGLLGLALHPEFGLSNSPNRNFLYVFYTAKGPNGEQGPFECGTGCFTCFENGSWYGSYLRLSCFRSNEDNTFVDPNTEQVLLNIRQINGSHRGGGLAFGLDQFLYLSIGDQARFKGAQNIVDNFEGGVIRIDVDQKGGAISHAPRRKMGSHTGNSDELSGQGYFIPNDNPWQFPNHDGFEEFYYIGNRAPHRLTVDQATGDIWVGEVGGDDREEVNIIKKGGNGGWPLYEGFESGTEPGWPGWCNDFPSQINLGFYDPPVADFHRNEANALIGGYVYRGVQIPELHGKYICGDYAQNRLFVVEKSGQKQELTTFHPGALITFGEDRNSELLMGRQHDHTQLYILKKTGGSPPAPFFLSQTGAFKNVESLEVADGLIPYDLVESFYSDGAEKFRWMAIPNDGSHDQNNEQVRFSENGNWEFPSGSVFIKHFELGGKRLETRFEVKADNGQYYFLTYKWNEDGKDATLVDEAEEEVISINGQEQVWHYPSRSECQVCHQSAAGSVLGVKTPFVNKDFEYTPGERSNQLFTYNHLGIFNPPIQPDEINSFLSMTAYDDMTKTIEEKAASYLALNCSNCHRPGTGNRSEMDLRLSTPLKLQQLIDAPAITDYGIEGARIVVPMDPERSMLYHRMNSLEIGVKMPPIGHNLLDTVGLGIIREWINSLVPDQADLVVEDIVLNPIDTEVGYSFQVQSQIKNQGTANASSSRVNIFLIPSDADPQPGTPLGSFTVPSLEPNDQFNLEFNFNLNDDFPPGLYELIIMLDAYETIEELDEANNTSSFMFQIENILPNLSFFTVSLGNNIISQRDSFRVSYTIVNMGNGASLDSTQLSYFLSTNDQLDTVEDWLLGIETVSPLEAAEEISGSSLLQLPEAAVPGAYFLLVVVDPDEQIRESNEIDNLLDLQVTVTPAVSIAEEQEASPLITLRPNPAQEDVVFQFNRPLLQSGILTILDTRGKEVVHYEIPPTTAQVHSHRIRVNTLPTGMYMWKFYHRRGFVFGKLLIHK